MRGGGGRCQEGKEETGGERRREKQRGEEKEEWERRRRGKKPRSHYGHYCFSKSQLTFVDVPTVLCACIVIVLHISTTDSSGHNGTITKPGEIPTSVYLALSWAL